MRAQGFVQKTADLWVNPDTRERCRHRCRLPRARASAIRGNRQLTPSPRPGHSITRAKMMRDLSFRHTASETLLWEPARSDIAVDELCAFVDKRKG